MIKKNASVHARFSFFCVWIVIALRSVSRYNAFSV